MIFVIEIIFAALIGDPTISSLAALESGRIR
jgi:hypothetical protein